MNIIKHWILYIILTLFLILVVMIMYILNEYNVSSPIFYILTGILIAFLFYLFIKIKNMIGVETF